MKTNVSISTETINIYNFNIDENIYNTKNFNYNYVKIDSNPTDTNYQISENQVMETRLLELKNKKSPLLISLLKYEDTEFGYKSESIRLIEEQLKLNRIATINWINDLYIENLNDEKVIIGILKILEYFPEHTLFPASHTIALASLLNENNEIKELAIRVFENWGSIKSYEILKTISTDTQWLKKYIDKIIFDLEEELCL